MQKQKKEQVLRELKENLDGISMCVVAHYSGLSAAQAVALRQAGREAEFSLRVAKNSLLKLAAVGTTSESLSASFSGPVIVAFTRDNDYLPMVKALSKFASKNEKFKIVTASIGGKLINSEGIAALATLPSFEELRRNLVFTLLGPATSLVTVLQKPAQELVRVLQAKLKLAETK